jgi:hypothetical protein
MMVMRRMRTRMRMMMIRRRRRSVRMTRRVMMMIATLRHGDDPWNEDSNDHQECAVIEDCAQLMCVQLLPDGEGPDRVRVGQPGGGVLGRPQIPRHRHRRLR